MPDFPIGSANHLLHQFALIIYVLEPLYLLYHDLEKNTSVEENDMPVLVPLDKYKTGSTRLVAVSIKANGSKTTKVVAEKDDSEFHFAPQQPFAVCNDEIVFTSYQLKSAGRSNYRVGLLKIR